MAEGLLLKTLKGKQFTVAGKDFHGWLAYRTKIILLIKGCL